MREGSALVPPPVGRYRGATGLQVAAALGTLYLVWGSTYLAIRVVVTHGLPALASMGVRFTLAGVLLTGILAVLKGPAVLWLTRRQLGSTAVIGMLLVFGGNGLVAVAERDIPSGLAALLVSVTPLLLACARALTGDRPRPRTWIGVALGLAGIAILVRPSGGGSWWAPLTVLAAACCWSAGSMISQRLTAPPDPFVSVAYQMIIAGVAQLAVGGWTEGWGGLELWSAPPGQTLQGWLALCYLILVGSLLGYTAYYWLLGHAPISLITTYTYVNPVVAVVLGRLLLDEQITGRMAAGGAVAVTGVVFVISAERSARRPAGEPPREVQPSS